MNDDVRNAEAASLADFLIFCQGHVLSEMPRWLMRSRISITRVFIICYMATVREVTLDILVEKFKVRRAYLIKVMRTMEMAGYVKINKKADNLRELFFRLTHAGVTIAGRIRDAIQARIIELMDEFDAPSAELFILACESRMKRNN